MQAVESAAVADEAANAGGKRPLIVFKSAGIVKQADNAPSGSGAASVKQATESKTKNPEAIDIDLPMDDDDDEDVGEDNNPEEEDQEAKVLEDHEDGSSSRKHHLLPSILTLYNTLINTYHL